MPVKKTNMELYCKKCEHVVGTLETDSRRFEFHMTGTCPFCKDRWVDFLMRTKK